MGALSCSCNRGMMKSKQAKAPEDGVDMISNLPDPIILSILSRIPTTEEVIRTSILSTRWRYLWTSVPFVDLDHSRGIKPLKKFEKEKFKELVYWVLESKSFNLDSFRLCCSNHYSMSTVRRWIYAAVTRNIKSLHLEFFPTKEFENIKFPRCLVTCGSLVVLRLNLFGRRLILPNCTGFLALRALELKNIELSDDNLLKDSLKSCPLLEDLSLIDCGIDELKVLCISCPNLKNLRFDNRNILKGLYKVDDMCGGVKVICPKLVFFEFVAVIAKRYFFESLGTLKKAVIHSYYFPFMADNDLRELVVGISHVESLSASYSILPYAIRFGSQNADVPVCLPNLKSLELTVPVEFEAFVELSESLVCLPHLESLHLIIEEEYFEWDDWKLDEADTRSILTCHLKRVEFLNFNKKKQILDIACSLLEHGNVLEEMIFRWDCEEAEFHERSKETMKEVSKFHKASSTVKLITINETSYY